MRLVRDDGDISVCNELCKSVIGFSRDMELRQAKDQGVATLIERDGAITGYAAGLGIFGHAVAKSNDDLKALIANASAVLGPGFFAPARNREVISWLLQNGFQIGWPANLMTYWSLPRTTDAFSSVFGILNIHELWLCNSQA